MEIPSIKKVIIKNIQENLDSQTIKKILKMVSFGPVLALYGSSIKSEVDRYLNIYTLKYLNEVYSGKFPIAYGSLFLPYELIIGLGLKPFLPEIMSGLTAGIGVSKKTIKAASDSWYSNDLCTFHR